MTTRRLGSLLAAVGLLALVGTAAAGPRTLAPLDGRPDAIVDLTTRDGVALVQGQWRYADTRIVETEFRAPGPDLRPSGAPIRTYDYAPHAGAADFDDSSWPTIAADTLEARRGTGKLSFNWYRIKLTIPQKVGGLDPTGSTVVFEVVVDDYAEVWVDGRLARRLGQVGGSLIGGFNAPNRVVLTRDARPGRQIQIAVFGANGPLSDPPANFIWIRSATLDFHKPVPPASVSGVTVERLDPQIDQIVPREAVVEKLAEGFQFTEGPVWVRDGGYLLFSDPNANTIYAWTPEGQLSVFRAKSGYRSPDIGEYGQPGSNGLTLDREGRLTINEHGNRRVTRLEKNGVLTVLADRYEGKRLNSPNDLVYKSDGALYFTDPPFGLPRFHADPRKELPYTGVFRYADGRLRLLATDLTGPNGIAFSPDEGHLYVTNWDLTRKVVMRYEVAADGGLANGRVFFDMTGAPGEEALDGLKVDQRGNLYVSGPGGLWIVSPEAKHLGTIKTPELPANFAWGDEDGRTLYMTARTSLYRVRLGIPGIRP
ncbi:MAG TPA: SMP-30/gluconolactonase/LRE family protein [Methylomirabilota bacterium]|nr:SMP-30/gluconolactonase/LRE family protein [Methylomirabilota bacterium]